MFYNIIKSKKRKKYEQDIAAVSSLLDVWIKIPSTWNQFIPPQIKMIRDRFLYWSQIDRLIFSLSIITNCHRCQLEAPRRSGSQERTRRSWNLIMGKTTGFRAENIHAIEGFFLLFVPSRFQFPSSFIGLFYYVVV